jgi:hypothetical protein
VAIWGGGDLNYHWQKHLNFHWQKIILYLFSYQLRPYNFFNYEYNDYYMREDHFVAIISIIVNLQFI